MNVFKRCIKGELSLAITFWGFVVLSNIIIGLINFALMQTSYTPFLNVLFLITLCLLKLVFSAMAASGIFFILRNKRITFWGVIAFLIAALNLLYSVLLFVSVVSFLLSYN